MSKIRSIVLLDNLRVSVQKTIDLVEENFRDLNRESFNWKQNEDSWSIAECLEHLNRYCDYYLPVMNTKMKASKALAEDEFSSTWLGKKSIEAVHPDNVKPQKTLARMNPSNSQITSDVGDNFLAHQQQLLAIIQQAENHSLSKVKIPIEFFKLLSINLGDCLQFMAAHQARHINQALGVLAAQTKRS